MTRSAHLKVVLGGLAVLACAEAAQAGLIFRRGIRRADDCGYVYSGAVYGRQYAYAPMYGSTYVYGYATTGYPIVVGPTTSAYADPLGIVAATGPLATDKARVRVHLPSPETRLWVNNQMVQIGGAERVFDLPLSTGQAQQVTLTAQWMKDGREVVRKKNVDVRPGQEVDVNVRESDADISSNGERLPVNPNPADTVKPKIDNP